MKKLSMLVVLMACSSTAFAWGNNQDQSQGQSQTAVGRVSTTNLQGQALLNKGNKTNVTVSEVNDYKETYRRYTPNATAPAMGVSATCKVGVSGGVGAPGFSASFGTYTTDEGCVEAESIRMGFESGNEELQAMAGTVLRNRLQRHIDEEADVAAVSLPANAPQTASACPHGISISLCQ